jgi:hypothetical protein
MKIKFFLLILTFLFFTSCSECRKCKKEEKVVKKIEVELINGNKKIVYYNIPSYADVSISASGGTYRMSTWKNGTFCVKQEITLMYGVVYCKVLN